MGRGRLMVHDCFKVTKGSEIKSSVRLRVKVFPLYCITHPYCARFVASLARAHSARPGFMRLSSPEKRIVIYS